VARRPADGTETVDDNLLEDASSRNSNRERTSIIPVTLSKLDVQAASGQDRDLRDARHSEADLDFYFLDLALCKPEYAILWNGQRERKRARRPYCRYTGRRSGSSWCTVPKATTSRSAVGAEKRSDRFLRLHTAKCAVERRPVIQSSEWFPSSIALSQA